MGQHLRLCKICKTLIRRVSLPVRFCSSFSPTALRPPRPLYQLWSWSGLDGRGGWRIGLALVSRLVRLVLRGLLLLVGIQPVLEQVGEEILNGGVIAVACWDRIQCRPVITFEGRLFVLFKIKIQRLGVCLILSCQRVTWIPLPLQPET